MTAIRGTLKEAKFQLTHTTLIGSWDWWTPRDKKAGTFEMPLAINQIWRKRRRSSRQMRTVSRTARILDNCCFLRINQIRKAWTVWWWMPHRLLTMVSASRTRPYLLAPSIANQSNQKQWLVQRDFGMPPNRCSVLKAQSQSWPRGSWSSSQRRAKW